MLNDFIEQFSNTRILVIGDLMLDRHLRGTASRICPEAPVPVVDSVSESANPGGAGNVARNIRALGGEAILAGIIGNDAEGRALRDLLENAGVNTEGVLVTTDRPTTSKTRIIADRQQVVRLDKEITDDMDNGIINRVLNFVNDRLRFIDSILISDYDKGLITPYLLQSLIPLARTSGKPVMIDPKFKHFPGYKGATVIKPNLKEACAITQISTQDETSVRIMGHWLLKNLECKIVLITRGKDGMTLLTDNGDAVSIPAISRDVYDVAGAGDTTVSAFTLGLTAGMNPLEAAVLSNVAGGLAVGKIGVTPISKSELFNEIKRLEANGQLGFERTNAHSG